MYRFFMPFFTIGDFSFIFSSVFGIIDDIWHPPTRKKASAILSILNLNDKNFNPCFSVCLCYNISSNLYLNTETELKYYIHFVYVIVIS